MYWMDMFPWLSLLSDRCPCWWSSTKLNWAFLGHFQEIKRLQAYKANSKQMSLFPYSSLLVKLLTQTANVGNHLYMKFKLIRNCKTVCLFIQAFNIKLAVDHHFVMTMYWITMWLCERLIVMNPLGIINRICSSPLRFGSSFSCPAHNVTVLVQCHCCIAGSRRPHPTLPAQHLTADRHSWRLAGQQSGAFGS